MYVAPIPQTMKALVIGNDETASVKEVPVPVIDDDEILVKVVAVALNPTDWKRMSPYTRYYKLCVLIPLLPDIRDPWQGLVQQPLPCPEDLHLLPRPHPHFILKRSAADEDIAGRG